ncbi:TetR/AcrR family transcriptional regulator [Jatrophihabitans sp. GAS493]|uniref:TetR/AcrR family transcriptional regulator n=1 Tax=Jatrophihabitans sp. GAS493 TaxID=1907575 RepID=UPI0012FD0C9A|nr:TetR/AcrR family transcriptional regulator [Jatrophihabitans sp. GAS493]
MSRTLPTDRLPSSNPAPVSTLTADPASAPDAAGAERLPDGRSHRWNEHREQRRAAIVAAGVRAVDEYGIEVGVHQIARSAHVSRTVLYRYFRDKDDLTQAMAASLSNEIVELIVTALEAEDTPGQMILATVTAIAEWVEAHPRLYHFLRVRSSSGSQPLENIEASVAAKLAGLLNAILSWLGAEPVISQIAAHAIVGLVENTLTWWVIDQTVPRDELCTTLYEFIWDAISGYLARAGLSLDLAMPLPDEVRNSETT